MPSKKKQSKKNHKNTIEDQNKAVDEESSIKPTEPEEKNGAEVIEDTNELELQQVQEKLKDYWDQILRLKADIENNLKRTDRDIENAHKYALKNFIEALLPVIDSMEMGRTAANDSDASLENVREGIDMTMSMFVQVLENQGLTQFDPQGEKFDPEQHQAISMVEDKKAKPNTIISVMQKGFMLNDRLVRPAMVVVAK